MKKKTKGLTDMLRALADDIDSGEASLNTMDLHVGTELGVIDSETFCSASRTGEYSIKICWESDKGGPAIPSYTNGEG